VSVVQRVKPRLPPRPSRAAALAFAGFAAFLTIAAVLVVQGAVRRSSARCARAAAC
jgi:hypothetical protein